MKLWWWPVMALAVIGLYLLISGVALFARIKDEEDPRRTRAFFMAAIGALMVMICGLIGAFSSLSV